ncbi:MAG TPA: hypothetical protein PK156_04675, partial [Polyangium sp.]|nr:hypothetical protein [Polyangium sp.]
MDDASRIQDLGRALAKAIDQAWLETRDRTFPEMVNAYRQVEADFVQRPGSNDFHILETKRRVAEAILRQANSTDQSFQVCQDAWNELVRLGFTNLERRCRMTWFYADCCLLHGQYEMGLALVEPLIAEFETALADPTCTEQAKRFYNQELEPLRKIRDEL